MSAPKYPKLKSMYADMLKNNSYTEEQFRTLLIEVFTALSLVASDSNMASEVIRIFISESNMEEAMLELDDFISDHDFKLLEEEVEKEVLLN